MTLYIVRKWPNSPPDYLAVGWTGREYDTFAPYVIQEELIRMSLEERDREPSYPKRWFEWREC